MLNNVIPANAGIQAAMDPRAWPGMTRGAPPAAQRIGTPLGAIGYRQAGVLASTRLVLLHGIGSGSASWSAQLAAVKPHQPGLLAWDAPGYGVSDGLSLSDDARPTATHYAERLWAWLDALGLTQPLTLVGHSLGALMAARAAVLQPQRVAALVLLAPAQGHARLSPPSASACCTTDWPPWLIWGPPAWLSSAALPCSRLMLLPKY